MINLYSLDTKEKLDAYGQEALLVTEDISVSETTGNSRAIALFHFNADFLNKSLTLVVGVYEVDANGEPINSKSLKPYEETIIATNAVEVDIQTPEFVIVTEEDKVEGGTYMGEYDAYVHFTKNNDIRIWTLFESIIQRSKTLGNI